MPQNFRQASSPGVIGATIGTAISNMGQYSARAAARANGVSAAAQSAQGAFNQASANNANTIGSQRLLNQWDFNSAQTATANELTGQWFNQSMEFNAEQAELQRKWLEHMDSTKYQRAVKDMETAGLNPILAATGGVSTGGGGGSAASISSPTAQSASGGLMNGLSASEGNYSGQMEYMGGLLGLLSAGIAGISSAMKAFGSLGDIGKDFGEAIGAIFSQDKHETQQDVKNFFFDRNTYNNKYPDKDSGFNRYYNPSSKWYIGNRKKDG